MNDLIDEIARELANGSGEIAEWLPSGNRPELDAADALRLVQLMFWTASALLTGVGEWLPDAGCVSDADLVWSVYACSLARRLAAEPLPLLIDSLDPPAWPGERT